MERLKKELGLFDVYAIATGAMFSSGFFLLPGLAAGYAGPAVVLAYFLAGLLILPAMVSMAELSTAMPRAGGAYYFLDRSLGPMAGTIGGLGTWLALVLKSAFALIGMGAYLGLFLELSIEAVALGFTALFTLVNIRGARETGGLQRLLVVVLLGVLAFFIVQGVFEVVQRGLGDVTRTQFTPFLPFGAAGLVSTVGLVFVSYAGLTKVASVAEEVEDPERNIPLGMFLSLLTATAVYVVGVYIMVAVLDPAALREDLTPVATAAEAFFDWLPGSVGLVLIVVAAMAAFASTGNAGIMSASRYLLAMSRDRLVWHRFAEVGRFGTPTLAVLGTGAALAVCLLTLDVEGVAKLASAFQLLIFSFVNLAVIVMRESRLEGYAPGYRAPAYPWMQIAGFLFPFVLIFQLGWMAIVFTLGVIAGSIGWYVSYAKRHVEREGAMYHLFERLGRRRSEGLEVELRQILKERVAPGESSFDELVTGAPVVDMPGKVAFEEAVAAGAYAVAEIVPGAEGETLKRRFTEERRLGLMPVSHGVALLHLRLPGIEEPRLLLLRASGGISRDDDEGPGVGDEEPIRGFFFLVSPAQDAARHLRTLAHLAARADDEGFMEEWLAARDEQQLKEAVLHEERYLSVRIRPDGPTAALVGMRLREVDMPEGSLVALIQRKGETVVPGGSTVLKEGDRLTIIGDRESVGQLAARYLQGGREKGEAKG